jgi:hypothetical protein
MSLGKTLAIAVFVTAPALFAATLPPVEPMPTVQAGLLAPAGLLTGAGYTVDPNVPVVGYMGQFTLRAPAGTFTADGTEMLAIRVSELDAIAKLGQLSRAGAFADALAASALKTGTAIGQVVTNPLGTIAGLPGGVGRFFESASTTLSRASEPSGAAGGSSGDATMELLGVNEAKRRIALQVGADPYTTNPVLGKQLDDMAQAAFAGGMSLDVAMAVSTAGVATAISATATVSNLVWDKSPVDVRTLNETQLAAMGVDGTTMRAFVTNRWFTPTLSVPFVESLAQIPNATGRSAVVALASTAASESEARFMVNAVSMARRVGTAADPVVAVDLDGWILVVRTRGGRVEVPAPVDYVVWTDTVEAMASRNMQGGQRNVLVSGLASTRAREGLQATGWAVQEHARR